MLPLETFRHCRFQNLTEPETDSMSGNLSESVSVHVFSFLIHQKHPAWEAIVSFCEYVVSEPAHKRILSGSLKSVCLNISIECISLLECTCLCLYVLPIF